MHNLLVKFLSTFNNHAVFANLELGWKSMLYLTLTGRNDTSFPALFWKIQRRSGFHPEIITVC